MSHTLLAFLVFICLFMLLTALIFGSRTLLIVKGQRKANDFKVDGSDVSDFMSRLSRAHGNMYESFVWIGGLLLLALATNNTHITDPFAHAVIAARVLQVGIHLASTSEVAVKLRFSFFMVQFVIVVYWITQFLTNLS